MTEISKNNKKEYLQIVKKLIDESFPLLKDKNIHIFVVNSKFYAHSIWIPPFIRFIAVSKSSEIFDEFSFIGLFAHELSHHEKYIKMGFINYLKFLIKFVFSEKSRIIEEKKTDRITIEKGYGRNLYELSVLQFKDKRRGKINRYYSTLEEIKNYAEEISKW